MASAQCEVRLSAIKVWSLYWCQVANWLVHRESGHITQFCVPARLAHVQPFQVGLSFLSMPAQQPSALWSIVVSDVLRPFWKRSISICEFFHTSLSALWPGLPTNLATDYHMFHLVTQLIIFWVHESFSATPPIVCVVCDIFCLASDLLTPALSSWAVLWSRSVFHAPGAVAHWQGESY